MRRLAVTVRLAAVAALSVAGVAALPAVSAQAAATPHYVGIVITADKSACVPWHSGITGDDVLNAVASVQYRQRDGLIDQIDGTPSPAYADDTHYWSYWHNTGGGWSYSNSGASGYNPAAGTVEGWRFVNGSSTASPPSSTSYAALCGGLDTKKAPAPGTWHPSSHRVIHPRSASHRQVAGHVPAAAASPVAAAARSAAVRRAAAASSASTRDSAPASSRPASCGAATTSCPSRFSVHPSPHKDTSGAVVVSGSPIADQHHQGARSAGSPLPTVLAIGLAVLLAAGATTATVLRRRGARG